MPRNSLVLVALLSLVTAGALRAQAVPADTSKAAAAAPAPSGTTSAATGSGSPGYNPGMTTEGNGAGIPVKPPRIDPESEPTLVFDREVFSFPAGPRRDPFTALVGKHDAGPLFDDLQLRGIIYSPGGNSLVVLTDGKKLYRAHRGEMVGNSRVVEVGPNRVIFSVDNFGVWRQQYLELKKNPEGDKG